MKERTCLLIKPDGIGLKKIGTILGRIESEGFLLLALKMVRLSREEAEDFYEAHRDTFFFSPFIRFMTSGPIVAAILEGEDAIKRVRKMIGATNSREAEEGTLRKLYGTDTRRNLVHGSDAPAAARREIRFFFKPEEVQIYDPDAWKR